jgi:hypothetical protein
MSSWRMRGAKEQAAAWVKDSGGVFHIAFLSSCEPDYETHGFAAHEPPRPANVLVTGDEPPYTGRLRDMGHSSYRLLAAFQDKGAQAVPVATGGDWATMGFESVKFLDFASAMKESEGIDGVALMFLRNGWPQHDQGSYSDWYGGIPIGIGDLRWVLRSQPLD